MVKHLSYKITL